MSGNGRSKAETRYLDTLVGAIEKLEVAQEALRGYEEMPALDRDRNPSLVSGSLTILGEVRGLIGYVSGALEEGDLRHVPQGMEVRRADYMERIERSLARARSEKAEQVPGEGPDLEAMREWILEKLQTESAVLRTPTGDYGAEVVLFENVEHWIVEAVRRFGAREEVADA